MTSTSLYSAKPFAVVVQAEIKPDRMDEFKEMIQANAVASRKEPGCLRFGTLRCFWRGIYTSLDCEYTVFSHQSQSIAIADVLQAQDDPNKFIFYEMYQNTAAVDFHKTQPHYAKWAEFKESGGTVSSVSHKMDGLYVP
jgi:quinol monooxygenase YgiN